MEFLAYAHQLLRLEFGVDPARTAVVGDRLDTDMQMGVDFNAKLNVLTLSGVRTVYSCHLL
jgi:ribonucleotide monophosphatase NagD (HAD superfamily)